ncbi:autotransporter outer membrane beta-barrel domain-containing protein [Phascolarctobacterium faecium]|uniref:autotransporter outer membrane beta-barrel domain-containing protein n=3 Tax=Phascolarctobacterium faecium TaxID=33025 RepID=UPI002431BE24|nr:autotransporter outer membrane beta-barrel domain-containing protein [Phascolarctobacterium faecium]
MSVMSKKEKLQKALAVSLMLTNIFCSPVWADPVDGAQGTEGAAITKNEDISGGVSDAYTAAAGTAGSGGSGGGKGGDGGNGGSVTVNDTVTGTIGGAIEITATGGDGAAGGAGNTSGGSWDADDGPHGNNGAGGDSQVVINVVGSGLATVNDISVTAQAGSGSVYTLTKNSSFVGNVGSNGGKATAIGLQVDNKSNLATITAADITISAVGGQGGRGGSSYNNGGDGGDGGNGGNATAYATYADNSKIQLTVDTVTATATAGAGGTAGAGATKIGYDGSSTLVHGTPGTDGTAGTAGMAKAYGIYATGSTVELKHSTPGSTITIGATATGTDSEAYAVYATDSNVVLQDKINITSGTTFLHNSTVAFTDRTADRTFTSSGELKLAGSNEFRVTTDLANNSADKFTFAKLVDNSSTDVQYITVGYDKSFDGSNLGSITGDVAVLTVTDLNGQNLDNFVGRKTTMDNPLERFTAMPTVETSGNDVKITGIEFGKTFDPSETAMTLSDAQMALGSMWRIEGNNLMKRMGELRSDKEAAQGGVWARYYRGELNTDSAYDRNFSQDYTAFQGGIDKVQDYKGGKLYTGIAVNRIDSNAGYTAGSGDLSSTGVGVYASWLGSKGHYIDVIARGSKLTNDFKLVDLSGNAAKADYDTWAYGISAEYGYRQNLNAGWFVEPQAELSLGHLGSADYTTSNEVSVKQDSVNSAVVRLGFLGGKEFTIGGHPSNAYVKASALHDFGGNGSATGYYGNDSLALQTGDLTGTWYEIGLGANLGIAKNSNLYFDALKTFGGNLRTDWQFNAGLRFTF